MNTKTICERIYTASSEHLSDRRGVILLYERCNANDDSNLVRIMSNFDGLIVVDNFYDPSGNNSAIFNHDKLLMYLSSTDPSQNKQVLYQAVCELNADWICFMRSGESFDYRFTNIRKCIENQDGDAMKFGRMLTTDGKNYYNLPDSDRGVYYEPRLYRFAKVSLDDIQNKDSLLNKSAKAGEKVLIHRKINSSELVNFGINVFTETLRFYGVYHLDGKYRNYEEIKDTELNELLAKKAIQIADYFMTNEVHIGNIGLYTGDSGIVLLLAQMYLWTKEEKYVTKMHQYLDGIIDLIQKDKYTLPTFCDGLAGFGWLLCYLLEKGLIDISEDYFEELDEILRKYMQVVNPDKDYDQLHGMLSIARYFLKRGLTADIRYMLNTLSEILEYGNNEIRWPTIIPDKGVVYDFGLAHGAAGVLYFLCKSYDLGIERELCSRLGRGIMKFYTNNEQQFDIVKSYYPYMIEHYQEGMKSDPVKCRLAWCYGDISTLMVIYQFALQIEDKDLEKLTIQKLIATTQRKDWYEVIAWDAGFCHGTSCLAHMYNRLYVDTGMQEFKETSEYWFKIVITMGMQNSTKSIGGYQFLENRIDHIWYPLPYLLEGVCGVGISLISAFDDNINWDEAMMLS